MTYFLIGDEMKKFLMFLFLSIFFISGVYAEEENNTEKSTNALAPNAKSAIIVEESTGEILYEHNSHEKLNPASMTKMMSLLLIMENIENGVIKWNDTITVSENASSMGGSQILLETGEEMSVEDLVKGVAIASGNELAVSIKQSHPIEEEIII